MSEKKKPIQFPLYSAILFLIYAVVLLPSFSFRIWNIVRVIGIGLIIFSLIKKRRDILLPVGLLLLTLPVLRNFFLYFGYGYYSIEVGWYDVETRFSLLCMLPWLCELIGYISAVLISIVCITNKLPQYKALMKSIWFVPAACIGGKFVFAVIADFIYNVIGGDRYWWGYGIVILRSASFFSIVLMAAAMLLGCIWICHPDGLPKTIPQRISSGTSSGITPDSANVSAENYDDAYCGLVKHILLLLLTCGIWLLIWIHRITAYTNGVKDEEDRNPTAKLLLCMFVPFYYIYWTYKTAQRIDSMAKCRGMSSDLSTLCLILSIFVPIIPPILMQEKMNSIVTHAPATPAAAADHTIQVEERNAGVNVNLGVAEELKIYKELLDAGVITQEEFDTKKRQLLGL